MQNPDDESKKYEEMYARSVRMKKRLTVALIVIAAVFVLMVVLIVILEHVPSAPPAPAPEYHFYEVFEGDILESPEYLALDRSVSYCADPAGYGLTTSVTDENRGDFDARVLFLCDWLDTVIAGDADAYNACFSADYLRANGRQKDFAQQMIYHTEIRYHSTNYTEGGAELVTYQVGYMIHRNNGTFRRDVDSDAMRPLYVTLTTDQEGKIVIWAVNQVYR